MNECLSLQPIQDRLQSCFIDIGDWLVRNESKWREEEVDDDIMSQFNLYHGAWEQLYKVPFVKPSNYTYDYFEKLLKDSKTSSDTFAHIIKATYENIMRFTILQHGMDADAIASDKDIKTMKMKAEELIRIINDNVCEVEISHVMLRNIYDVTMEGLTCFDPDPFSGLHDACAALKTHLSKNSELRNVKMPEPPKISIEAKPSALIRILKLKGQIEKEQKLLGDRIFDLPKETFSKLYTSGSDLSFGQIALELREEEEHQPDYGEKLIDMHNIWIELDPIIDRLAEIKGVKQYEVIINGTSIM